MTIRWTLGIVIGGVLMTACGGGGGGGGTTAPARANLSQVADCDELHETLRADARHKIAVQAETLRAQAWQYLRPGGEPGGPTTPVGLPTPVAASTAGG